MPYSNITRPGTAPSHTRITAGALPSPQVHRRDVSRDPGACEPCGQRIQRLDFQHSRSPRANSLAHFASQAESVLADDALAAMAALTTGSLVCLALAWRGRNVPIAAGALTLGVVVALGAMGKARMDAQPLGSYRELARAITPYLGSGCRMASYRHFVQSLPFYTGHREALVDYRGELAPFGLGDDARESFISTDAELAQLWRGPGCAILIVNRDDLSHLRALLGSAATIVGCEGKKLALYNRAVAPPDSARLCTAAPGRGGLGFTAR